MTGKQAYARDAICLKLAPIPFAFLCLYQGGPGEAGGREEKSFLLEEACNLQP